MTQVELSGPVVTFTPCPGDETDEQEDIAVAATDPESLDYARAREQAERAAAKKATTSAARSRHQELAQAYAALSASAPG